MMETKKIWPGLFYGGRAGTHLRGFEEAKVYVDGDNKAIPIVNEMTGSVYISPLFRGGGHDTYNPLSLAEIQQSSSTTTWPGLVFRTQKAIRL